VSAVLRSLDLQRGDELLATDHGYNACRNCLEFVAARTGAAVVVAQVPFPLASADEVVQAVLEKVTPATRLALLDHVTSPTALIFPIERLVRELAGRGVDTLVDGAHAPGMVPLNVERLGAAYYAANCHKWLCAPKGSGFLYVRPDLQPCVRPAVISHGANSRRTDRSRFMQEFDWTGTDDPSAVLCVPAAINFMKSLLPGGWPELMARNREVALRERGRLAAALSLDVPCPDGLVGAMAALMLPADAGLGPAPGLGPDPLHTALRRRHGIDAMIAAVPGRPRKCLRLSAMLYNEAEDYERLAQALGAELGRSATA
jgi:isopenicillin-N epimerase